MDDAGISIAAIDRLRLDLSVRLQVEGWGIRGQPAHDPQADADELATFCKPLNDDYRAVAIFAWTRGDESSRLNLVGGLGVEYAPAREILERLTGSEIYCVILNQPTVLVEAADGADASKIADQLAQFLSDQARRLPEIADVERLIDLLSSGCAQPFAAHMAGFYAMDVVDPEPDGPDVLGSASGRAEMTAALLAGAGRYGDARRALEEGAQGCIGQEADDDYSRFARQLSRFIDAEGRLPLPLTPPRWPSSPPAPEPRPSALQVLAAALPEGGGRRAAIDAVRAASPGRARNELRALLEDELSQRGVSMGIRDVEPTLDLIVTEQEPFGKVRIAVRGLKGLKGAASASRSEAAPSEPMRASGHAPTGPARPDRAAYPLGCHTSIRRSIVDLDPEAYALLGSLTDLPAIEIWLTRHAESPPTAGRLKVHIGTEQVGQLNAEASDRLRPAMEAAEERDEDPWTYASLLATFGAAPYVLTIGLPATEPPSTGLEARGFL